MGKGDDDAAKIRREFPLCTAFADQVRAVFGPGVRLIHIRENCRERGRKPGGNAVSVAQMNIDPAPCEKAKPRPPPREKRRWEESWDFFDDNGGKG